MCNSHKPAPGPRPCAGPVPHSCPDHHCRLASADWARCACLQVERAEDALQTEDKQLQQQVSVLLKMSRLLMLEEATYEQDASR